jgi:hypothetical protein
MHLLPIEVISQLADSTTLCEGKNLLSLGLLPQFTEKDQLQYLLVAPKAVHRASLVDKTAALTGFALDRIIGTQLAPTLGTKQSVWIGRSTALLTLTCFKFDATSFAKTRISII